MDKKVARVQHFLENHEESNGADYEHKKKAGRKRPALDLSSSTKLAKRPRR